MKYPKDPSQFTATIVPNTNFLEGYFHSMLNYFRGINRPPDQILVLKLKELLIALMNSDPLLSSYFGSIANTVRPPLAQIMEQNFCFNLKLEDFAELCHRSLSTFKRDFRQEYEISPGRWLLQRRVHHAARLIANSDLTFSQIAYESGFEDLSHFSRAYKKIMGNSPSQYKKSSVQA